MVRRQRQDTFCDRIALMWSFCSPWTLRTLQSWHCLTCQLLLTVSTTATLYWLECRQHCSDDGNQSSTPPLGWCSRPGVRHTQRHFSVALIQIQWTWLIY